MELWRCRARSAKEQNVTHSDIPSSRRPIVVIGSINMDLVARVPRLPGSGETVIGASFAVIPGGKGANQAVAAARLGGEVHLIGRVGKDDFGRATAHRAAGQWSEDGARPCRRPASPAVVRGHRRGRCWRELDCCRARRQRPAVADGHRCSRSIDRGGGGRGDAIRGADRHRRACGGVVPPAWSCDDPRSRPSTAGRAPGGVG